MKTFNIKKIILAAIILTAVMVCVLLYELLIDFSYDEKIAEESIPMIIVDPVNTTYYEKPKRLKDFEKKTDEYNRIRKKAEKEKGEYDWTRRKVEKETDEYGDEKVLSRRQRRRLEKTIQNKSY